MLKKTITYTNFNDEEVSEDHFFHLSKAELVELELSHQDGLSEALKRIIDAQDGKAIIAEFKKIILGSYGRKSVDGKRFIKTQELRDEFESSEAYSTLFMELVTNTDAAIDFINGIVPQGLEADAAKVTQLRQVEQAPAVEPKTITRADITAMSQEELAQLGADISAGKVVIAE